MYKKVSIKKLGMKRSHRNAVVNNQLRTLFTNGKLNTTTPKAKVVKAQAESLIAKAKMAKEGDLSLRRKLQNILGNDSLVKKTLEYAKKAESKVKFVKVGFRDGDNAEVSRIELSGFKTKTVKKSTTAKEEKETKVEKKEVREDVKKNIEKLGEKRVKKANNITKERARSRSGL